MKYPFVFMTLLGLALAAPAQEAGAIAAERARIANERAAAESAFHAEEKACYGKFAVNDCLNAAKAKRRGVVADLRRQEISLNDVERRRRAADKVRELEQRAAAEAKKPARAASGTGRESAVAHTVRPPKAPREAPSSAAQSPAPKPKQVDAAERAAQEAKSRAQHEERQAQAKERRAKLEKRLAERNKPAANPLPVPP